MASADIFRVVRATQGLIVIAKPRRNLEVLLLAVPAKGDASRQPHGLSPVIDGTVLREGCSLLAVALVLIGSRMSVPSTNRAPV